MTAKRKHRAPIIPAHAPVVGGAAHGGGAANQAGLKGSVANKQHKQQRSAVGQHGPLNGGQHKHRPHNKQQQQPQQQQQQQGKAEQKGGQQQPAAKQQLQRKQYQPKQRQHGHTYEAPGAYAGNKQSGQKGPKVAPGGPGLTAGSKAFAAAAGAAAAGANAGRPKGRPPHKKQRVDIGTGADVSQKQQVKQQVGRLVKQQLKKGPEVDGQQIGQQQQQQHQQQQQQQKLHKHLTKQVHKEQLADQQQPQPQQQQQQQQPAGKKQKKRKRAAEEAAADGAAAAALDPGRIAAVARAPPGSNWQALKQQLAAQAAAAPRKRRPRPGGTGAGSEKGGEAAGAQPITSIGSSTALTPVVALDCEFVGVGPGGEMDALARVSVVNNEGNVLLDTFVEVKEKVTDYRTWVSGVRPQDLVGAPSLEEVAEKVAKLAEGRIIVGHSLSKDLKVLLLSHPRKDIRDTAKFPPFMYSRGGKRRPQALRQLAKKELGLEIQTGEHSSVDDARAALYLYHKVRKEWERAARAGVVSKLPTAGQSARRHASYGSRDIRDDPMADL